MGVQVNTKVLTLPCGLLELAVDQISEILYWMAIIQDDRVVSVVTKLSFDQWKPLKSIIHEVFELFNSDTGFFLNAEGQDESWLATVGTSKSPVTRALEALKQLTDFMPTQEETLVIDALSLLKDVFSRIETESFASAITLEKERFLHDVATLRSSKCLGPSDRPKITGEERVNW